VEGRVGGLAGRGITAPEPTVTADDSDYADDADGSAKKTLTQRRSSHEGRTTDHADYAD